VNFNNKKKRNGFNKKSFIFIFNLIFFIIFISVIIFNLNNFKLILFNISINNFFLNIINNKF